MSTVPPLPGVDDVLLLPAALEATVEPAYIDFNGHMNVRHYLDLGAMGMQVVVVHVDMDSRRSVPLPADVAAGFDALIAESSALPWPAPVCGALGVRIRNGVLPSGPSVG